MNRTTLLQIGHVARRSVLRTARQPAQIVPALIFPMFLLAVNSSGLQRATSLPHFPTHSFLTFALAIPFMQGALFSVMNAGTDLARDVETGFLNRLALTPLSSASLLTGLLGGALVLGIVQAVVYLTVGVAAGASFAAGFPGVLVIVALSMLLAIGFGCIGLFVALRTGWFSDRSAAYLASARPVVLQDTGFSAHLPVTGGGLFAVTAVDDAVAALQAVCSDYGFHCKMAREIAEQYFDASVVLGRFLAELGI